MKILFSFIYTIFFFSKTYQPFPVSYISADWSQPWMVVDDMSPGATPARDTPLGAWLVPGQRSSTCYIIRDRLPALAIARWSWWSCWL